MLVRKILRTGVLVFMFTSILAGCRRTVQTLDLRYEGDPGGKKVTMDRFESFDFSFSSGYYMNSGNAYSAVRDGDRVIVKVRLDSVPDEEVPEIETDAAFMERLEQIVRDHNVAAWNGFSRSQKNVLDGDSFHLYIRMANGETLGAGGYEAWPEGYGSVRGELESLFVGLYEEHYPSREKALERYYQEELVPKYGISYDSDVEYPYISAGGDQFIYGSCPVQEGMLGHWTGDYTGSKYRRDPGDMLVAYLYTEPAEEFDYSDACLRFEVYTVDDDMQVRCIGGDFVDADLFWNDSLYSYFFTHYTRDRMVIGYFSQKRSRAGSRKKTGTYSLYEYRDGEIRPAFDYVLEGSMDTDLTWDDLAELVPMAEEFRFPQSLAYWKEHPSDPVIKTTEINELVSFHTGTNYGKGFHEALTATPEGQPVEGFLITGQIRGRNGKAP